MYLYVVTFKLINLHASVLCDHVYNLEINCPHKFLFIFYVYKVWPINICTKIKDFNALSRYLPLIASRNYYQSICKVCLFEIVEVYCEKWHDNFFSTISLYKQ